jgi:adenylate cyclase
MLETLRQLKLAEDDGASHFEPTQPGMQATSAAASTLVTESGRVSSLAQPPRTGTEESSIAVLPFQSLSPDPEDGYLAAGLASEVIRALTGVPGLRVAPQLASFRLEQASDPVEVAKTLNTRYVVVGNLRRAGGRLRVTVELLDAIEERVAWAQSYDRLMTDIFALQEDISKAIVSSLGGHFIRAVTDFAYRTPTQHLDAWGLVRKAYHIWNYEFSPQSVPQAMSMLRRAMELDPDYASAHAYLAMYLMQTILHGVSRNPESDFAEAVAAAERACELAPQEPEVLACCSLVWLQNSLYEKAVQCLKRAIQVAPFDLVSWGYLALAHACAGGPKEVLEAHRILTQLIADAPDHPSLPYWLGFLTTTNLRLDRIEEALDTGRRCVELQPGYTFHQVLLAEALCRSGQTDESGRVLAAIQQYSPGFTLGHFETICMGITRSAATIEKICGCVKPCNPPLPMKEVTNHVLLPAVRVRRSRRRVEISGRPRLFTRWQPGRRGCDGRQSAAHPARSRARREVFFR